MAEVTETQLPGVGVRYDFVTSEGDRVGVLATRTGRRELLLYDHDDPDACRAVVRLDVDDTHTLGELMGASQVSENMARMQSIEGVTLDWLVVGESSRFAGHALADMRLRTVTGVSVVAVVRDEQTFPAPGADFVLQAGDTAVVVGTPETIQQAAALFRSS